MLPINNIPALVQIMAWHHHHGPQLQSSVIYGYILDIFLCDNNEQAFVSESNSIMN